jgi:mannose-1-phosphate guanylyltransferase/mannose-6-phosphate isomerase
MPKQFVSLVGNQSPFQLMLKPTADPSLFTRAKPNFAPYQEIDSGARYQVKHIVVKPGGQLSLQKPFPSGRALGSSDGHGRSHGRWQHQRSSRERIPQIPSAGFIGLPTTGRFRSNIEAQLGSHLGEDDIVRMDDDR